VSEGGGSRGGNDQLNKKTKKPKQKKPHKKKKKKNKKKKKKKKKKKNKEKSPGGKILCFFSCLNAKTYDLCDWVVGGRRKGSGGLLVPPSREGLDGGFTSHPRQDLSR